MVTRRRGNTANLLGMRANAANTQGPGKNLRPLPYPCASLALDIHANRACMDQGKGQTMTELQGMSLAEATAYVKRLREEASEVISRQKAEIASAGEEFFNLLITTQEFETTEKTGRVGISVMSMEFTGEDGRKYTASVHLTDVEKTAENKKALAVKAAEEEERKKQEEQANVLLAAAERNPALKAALAKLEADTAREESEGN